MAMTNDTSFEIPTLIRAEGITLTGTVAFPRDPVGVVVFAVVDSGSYFHQIDEVLARGLRKVGIATMRLDLLSEAEAADPIMADNVHLPARRLLAATECVEHMPECAGLPLGYAGAAIGAAAALLAAAEAGPRVRAVVARNGRLDLVADAPSRVTGATLLVVRNIEQHLLATTYEALPRLGGEKALAILPGHIPLVEDPRALDQLAWLVTGWYSRYL
jgi:hypothetical protein